MIELEAQKMKDRLRTQVDAQLGSQMRWRFISSRPYPPGFIATVYAIINNNQKRIIRMCLND
jgi:hypothetical protein